MSTICAVDGASVSPQEGKLFLALQSNKTLDRNEIAALIWNDSQKIGRASRLAHRLPAEYQPSAVRRLRHKAMRLHAPPGRQTG